MIAGSGGTPGASALADPYVAVQAAVEAALGEAQLMHESWREMRGGGEGARALGADLRAAVQNIELDLREIEATVSVGGVWAFFCLWEFGFWPSASLTRPNHRLAPSSATAPSTASPTRSCTAAASL